MKGRALCIACGIPAAIVLFLLLTLLFVPNDAIKGVVVRAADNAGYTVAFSGFGKAFPAGFKAATAEISSGQGALLKLRDARVRLLLLPLVAGKVKVAYSGMIGSGGEVGGEISIGRTRGWSVRCKGVRLEDVPFFTTVAQARVRGELKGSGSVQIRNNVPEGDLQLDVQSAELAGVKLGAMPLPDAGYRHIQGALRVEQGKAVLKSFTLDGDGVYVRLKGQTFLAQPVANSQLNLAMEMMPKPAFLERQKFVFLLLGKYQTTPGAFTIPIRGTLGHPSI